MPCYCPLKGFYSKDFGASGKRGITFSRDNAWSGAPLFLPCGQCIGCRLDKARQWAIRCMHEKQLHAASSFLTLTYEDKKVPAGGTLVKRDLVLFMKRLRQYFVRQGFGDGVRFYACGEYGETTLRPHYHVLLLSHDFPDKVYWKKAKSGLPLYNSDALSRLWPDGFSVVGTVDFDSCCYVARYIMKKRSGPSAAEYYGDVIPEFTVMSRNPGLGLRWFEKYGEHAFQLDSVVFKNREVRPPRYYEAKYELVDSASLERIKLKRRLAAQLHRADNTVDRRRVRELVELKRLEIFKRDVP